MIKGLVRSLADTFAPCALAFALIWTLFALLNSLEPVFDGILFAQLLVMAPLHTEWGAWSHVAFEVFQFALLSGVFIFLRRGVGFVLASVFFLMLYLFRNAGVEPLWLAWSAALDSEGVADRWRSLALLPYVVLMGVAIVAAVGLTPLSRRFDRLVAKGLLPRLSRDDSKGHGSGRVFWRWVSVASAGWLVLSLNLWQPRGPHGAGIELPRAASMATQRIVVVPDLSLTSLRKASSGFGPRAAAWMAQSHEVWGHVPSVPLARPMRWELLSGSSALADGVHSNADLRPERPRLSDLLLQKSDDYGVALVSTGSGFDTAALWFGVFSVESWSSDFKVMSRLAINPFFAQMIWDRDAHAGGAGTQLTQEVPALSVPSSAKRVVVELPPFPALGTEQAQRLYFERTARLLAQWTGSDQDDQSSLTLIGLPPESFVKAESTNNDDLPWLVRAATGVAVRWSTDLQPRQHKRAFEDRLRDVEEGSSIIATHCLGSMVQDHAAPCAQRPNIGFMTRWPQEAEAVLPSSRLRRFLVLTAAKSGQVPGDSRLGLGVRVDQWPAVSQRFDPDDWDTVGPGAEVAR
jgi:hypothetical protein